MEEKQIVCMLWDKKKGVKTYCADDVNRLYNSIRRNLSFPFQLICLTDVPDGIDPAVKVLPCPVVPFPPPMDRQGWRKVSLWAKPEFNGIEGQFLYLDLDIIITGSLDGFFTYKPEAEYVVMFNYTTPDKRIGNTSIFRMTSGMHPEVYEKLCKDPAGEKAKWHNSQTYVSNAAPSIEFFPLEWVRHFKTHLMPPWPLRFFKQPQVPPETKIVVCTGHPTPAELALGKWQAPWYKKIYKTIPPCKFVQENWR